MGEITYIGTAKALVDECSHVIAAVALVGEGPVVIFTKVLGHEQSDTLRLRPKRKPNGKCRGPSK